MLGMQENQQPPGSLSRAGSRGGPRSRPSSRPGSPLKRPGSPAKSQLAPEASQVRCPALPALAPCLPGWLPRHPQLLASVAAVVLLAVNLRLHAACSYTPHLHTHTHTQAPTHRLPIPACHLLTLAPQDLDDDCGEVAETKSRYVVAELPVRLPVLRPALDKPNPKLGVGEWWLTDTGPAVAGAWLAGWLAGWLG